MHLNGADWFIFNAAQLDFQRTMPLVRAAQAKWETRGQAMVDASAVALVAGDVDVRSVAWRCNAHAVAAVSAWWELADALQLRSSHPSVIYPSWWLQAVNYSGGPPPSPRVPPVHV